MSYVLVELPSSSKKQFFFIPNDIVISSNFDIDMDQSFNPNVFPINISWAIKSNKQPEVDLSYTAACNLWPVFGYYFYNIVHVLPDSVNIGFVSGNVEYSIELWNATYNNIIITSIDETGTSGLSLTNELPIPLTIGPLQSIIYILHAGPGGPPIINARYLFTFTGWDFVALLNVTGTRAVLFGFSPDWSYGFSERLHWLTDVLESYNGLEQRVSLRRIPRRSFEYSFLLNEQDASALDNLLLGRGGQINCLPVWTDVTVINKEINKGSRNFFVNDRVNSDYHVGGFATLWLSNISHKIVEIMAISGNEITIKHPLELSWPIGTRIFPCRTVNFVSNISVKRITNTVSMGKCNFSVYDINNGYISDYGADYGGYKVFDLKPDWSEDIDDDWDRKLQILDYQTGPVFIHDESGFPKITHKLTWLIYGRENITIYRAWLSSRYGKLNPFWIPTFESDFQVTKNITELNNYLIIKNVGYSLYVFGSHLRNHILIETTSGVFYREIINSEVYLENEEKITLSSPLGIDLKINEIINISYLELVRLNNDSVEFFWETNNICRVQLSVRVLRS